nr:hypothetical protein B0A51_14230 [Rachicladosporium sp. CCFEE 5018]
MAHSRTSRPSRQDQQSMPGLNSSQRSWTDPSGMHFTVKTTSYTSPGLSFALNGGSTSFASPDATRSSNAGAGLVGGLLGGALGLLDGMMSLQRQQQQRRAQRTINGATSQPVLPVFVEESDESDSNTSFENESDHDGNTRSRGSVFGKLRTRLQSGLPQQGNTRGMDGRQRTATRGRQDEKPQMRAREVSVPSMESDAAAFSTRGRLDQDEISYINGALIELEQSVERQKQSYLRAKRRYQQASQRTMIESLYIEDLLDEMTSREQSYTRGTQRLEELKRIARDAARRSRPRPETRQTAPQQRPRAQPELYTHQVPLPHSSATYSRPQTANIDPLFQAFQSFGSFGTSAQPNVFDRLFDQMEADLGARSNTNGFYFTTSGTVPRQHPTFSSTRPTYTSTGPAPGPIPSYTTYNVVPDPPLQTFPNALRPDEALNLYETYNNRWRALTSIDALVPYPTRSLKAASLLDPTTIPHPTAPDWSSEQIMQANTQLFFLLAFKLQPVVMPNGTIQVDRANVLETNVTALKAALKKEKMRWHSDTLGRRNGGGTLVNGGLQKDEKARAVFHGVCGLMEIINGNA